MLPPRISLVTLGTRELTRMRAPKTAFDERGGLIWS
jgi:hypothetical protein